MVMMMLMISDDHDDDDTGFLLTYMALYNQLIDLDIPAISLDLRVGNVSI